MPNTRSAAKRARQSDKRQDRNQVVKTATKSALRKALAAIEKHDTTIAKEAYMEAVKALSKAVSKGTLPARRGARKISRLTRMAKKLMPESLPFESKAAAPKAKKKTTKAASAKA